MTPADLAFAGVARQAELVRSGEVSARELVAVYLERIAMHDPDLNAFRTVFAEEALDAAAEVDDRRQRVDDAPLLGVPIAIKDDTEIAGKVASQGGRAQALVADVDSEVVRRLRRAGAILIGQTNVPELEIWPFTSTRANGVTRNPWLLTRTPGGSSGGSAAAVAAGLVGAATGSDGMGSIRIPASCCGLVGIKPQRGRVSLRPTPDAWHGLATRGPLARRVVDAALLLDVLSGAASDEIGMLPPEQPFEWAATAQPPNLRIAVSTRVPPPVMGRLHPEVQHAIDRASSALLAAGHTVHEDEVEYGASLVHASVRYLRGVRDAADLLSDPELLEPRTKGFVRLGRLVPTRLLDAVRRAELETAATVGQVFSRHDVVLAPVVLGPTIDADPWPGRSALRTLWGSSRFAPYTGVWNALGNPAVTVPVAEDHEGVPIGVQLVGRPGDEATLISLAAQLESVFRWDLRRPPLPPGSPGHPDVALAVERPSSKP